MDRKAGLADFRANKDGVGIGIKMAFLVCTLSSEQWADTYQTIHGYNIFMDISLG